MGITLRQTRTVATAGESARPALRTRPARYLATGAVAGGTMGAVAGTVAANLVPGVAPAVHLAMGAFFGAFNGGLIALLAAFEGR